MLKYGISIGMLPVIGAVASSKSDAASPVTPAQTKGPFYPIHRQLDKDADLTSIEGDASKAAGRQINVVGRVQAPNGASLSKAIVEIWQADTNGRYRHARDPNPATLDPHFQGWGISTCDDQGMYRFLTVLPGVYPAGPGWMRPPHIHFKVVMQGYQELITQMYFPGDKYNASDLILQNLSKADQSLVIAKRVDNFQDRQSFHFDIVLAPV